MPIVILKLQLDCQSRGNERLFDTKQQIKKTFVILSKKVFSQVSVFYVFACYGRFPGIQMYSVFKKKTFLPRKAYHLRVRIMQSIKFLS